MATIRKLPSGSWNVQVRLKGRSPVSKTFKTKAEAVRWARTQEALDIPARPIALPVPSGLLGPPQIPSESTEVPSLGPSLAELFDKYEAEVSPLKKGHAMEVYRLARLKSRIGHLGVSLVTSKDVAGYRDQRLKEVSSGTVLRELVVLSHVFEVARIEWGYRIDSNPVKLIRKPKKARERDRRLDPGELQSLLQELQGNALVSSLVLLAIETGMRRGELVSMGWKDIDLQRRTVFLRDTKNGESRMVPLSTKAVSILQGLREIAGKASGPVFSLQPHSVTQAFQRACERAGIRDLRFHDLRHEATSRLFEKGLNMMEVSSITGHKTLSMLKRYTHLKASELALKLGLLISMEN
jgi:integrase